MKANAPERIYVKITHPISDEYTEIIAFKDGDGIEYIHTDAFIEEAINYLKNRLFDVVKVTESGTLVTSLMTKDGFIEEFRKAMKGE